MNLRDHRALFEDIVRRHGIKSEWRSLPQSNQSQSQSELLLSSSSLGMICET